MLIWFNKGNKEHLQAVQDVELMKFELSRLKTELSKMEKALERANSNIDAILSNLNYLKKYAKIVNLFEYQRTSFILTGEYHTVLSLRKMIPERICKIKKQEESVEQAERVLAFILSKKSNILEFKKRD